MSKSLEDMISEYINKYLTSENNEYFIYKALISSLRKSINEFISIMPENDLNHIFASSLSEIEILFENWDERKNFENHRKLLTFFLYSYIKLKEAADILNTLDIYYLLNEDDEVDSYETYEKQFDSIMCGIGVITTKISGIIKTADYEIIEFADLMVKTNVFKCNKNHEIEQIQAKVNVIDYFGKISEITVPAGYCKDCNCYFLLTKDFENLKRYGVILCRIVSEEVYRNTKSNNDFDLKAESILHQAGYNVSASENLSDIQRHEILRRVVDFGLYSISGLRSFLDYLIDKNLRVTTRDMSSAINKWRSDRNYIATYNSKVQRQVTAESFIRKQYIQ